MRYPLGAVSWVSLLQHLVDLLKTETLGFWNQEVGEQTTDSAEATIEEEDAGAHIGTGGPGRDEVWVDDTDDAVPEPVGCG